MVIIKNNNKYAITLLHCTHDQALNKTALLLFMV